MGRLELTGQHADQSLARTRRQLDGRRERELGPVRDHVGSHVGSNVIWTRISKLEHLVRAMFCAPGRTRTYDRQIRRLLLYPLSYGGQNRAVRPYGRLGHHCSAGAGVRASSYAMNPHVIGG